MIAALHVNTHDSHHPDALLQPLALPQNQYLVQFQLFQVAHTIILKTSHAFNVNVHLANHHAADLDHAHLAVIIYS